MRFVALIFDFKSVLCAAKLRILLAQPYLLGLFLTSLFSKFYYVKPRRDTCKNQSTTFLRIGYIIGFCMLFVSLIFDFNKLLFSPLVWYLLFVKPKKAAKRQEQQLKSSIKGYKKCFFSKGKLREKYAKLVFLSSHRKYPF